MKMIVGGLSNKKRIAIVCTVFLFLASMLTLGSAAYQKSRLKGAEGEKGGYLYQVYGEASGEQGAEQEESAYTVLVLGKDYDSNRTDAIICVSFNGDGSISTLQIPRDTYVSDGDYKGRINGLLPMYRAYAIEDGDEDPTDTGATALMKKIESDFGIECNGYVFLDSNAVAAITDALGGVTVDIPMDIDYTDKDRALDLHLKAGVQRLDGKTAAQFIRYRQGYPQADIGRINAQKLYAAAMLDKLQSLSSVSAVPELLDTASAYVKTDLDADTMAFLATKLCMAKAEELTMYTLPGDGVNVNGGSYYGVFAGKLCEVLEKGFGVSTEVSKLGIQDFTSATGGYRDTDGVKLSTILEEGLAIPVYAD